MTGKKEKLKCGTEWRSNGSTTSKRGTETERFNSYFATNEMIIYFILLQSVISSKLPQGRCDCSLGNFQKWVDIWSYINSRNKSRNYFKIGTHCGLSSLYSTETCPCQRVLNLNSKQEGSQMFHALN